MLAIRNIKNLELNSGGKGVRVRLTKEVKIRTNACLRGKFDDIMVIK